MTTVESSSHLIKSRLIAYMTACGAAVLAFSLWAWLAPSADNWGGNAFAFLPSWLAALLLAVMTAALFPNIQRAAVQGVGSISSRYARLTKAQSLCTVAVLILAAVALMWLGRERTTLLGDGSVVGRTMLEIKERSDIATSSLNSEPLTLLMNWEGYVFLSSYNHAIEGADAVRIVSIAVGMVSILIFWLLSRALARSSSDRLIIFLTLLAAGGSQFFFGYVEDYAPLYAGTALLLLLLVRFYRGEISVAWPIMWYAVLVNIHFASLIYAPVLLLAVIRSVRHRHFVQTFGGMFGALIIVIGVLWFIGFTPATLWDRLARGSSLLVPAALQTENYAYPAFSLFHVVDIVNECLLVAPMALPVVLFGGVLLFTSHQPKRDAVFIVLLLSSVCGGAFIFLTHSGIGVSRDWDLYASFVMPSLVAALYIWYGYVQDKHVRERMGVLICAVSMAMTTGYIATNASADRSTQRFQTLVDARYWTVPARIYAYDELAAYYREGADFPAALAQYRNYLSLDPSHPRILANAGFMAEAVGDSLAAAQFFTRSIQNGGDYIDMYTDLGKMYASHANIDGAIGVYSMGLRIDSLSLPLNSALGQAYYNDKRNYPAALVCFLRLIKIDPQLAAAWMSAGLCYIQMGEPQNGLPYLKEYLQQNPSDAAIARLVASLKK